VVATVRLAARDRLGLPCARLQRFTTAANARAYSVRCQRGQEPYLCECGRYHLRKLDEATMAAHRERLERERKARVAAYLRAVPEKGRGE
jgi:hypothetical protein